MNILCLMGPTGSGKTALAMELIQTTNLPIEIISVDSAMVYRGLDIGTAKPTLMEQKLFPHHLIDICDPATPYSAGQFYKDVTLKITDIHAQNRIPLLVGGSMLYFRALQQPFSDLPTANIDIRKKIEEEANINGWSFLHQRLQEIDPISAEKIHAHDKQRIQRALEIYEVTRQSPSQHHHAKNESSPYQFINFVYSPLDRNELYQRIELRFKNMLAQGFLEEVNILYQRNDLSSELPAIRSVGYRQAWQYLAGQYSHEIMCEEAIKATRHLAKRQLTWLRQWPNAIWIDHKQGMSHIQSYLKTSGSM